MEITQMRALLDVVKRENYLQLDNSVSLVTKEEVIEDQKGWDDTDLCKYNNFSLCDFWLMPIGEGEPTGISNEEDLYDELVKIKFNFGYLQKHNPEIFNKIPSDLVQDE